MPTVAYLANLFPSPVETYVTDEIRELRRHGLSVLPCSVRLAEAHLDEDLEHFATQTLSLYPLRFALLARSGWFCLRRLYLLKEFFHRALLRGNEPPGRRLRALLHTWLGVCYALLLEGRGIQHIHVHHGYFGSWVAMVAAEVLGIDFSMTLHGSDLLLHAAYLDIKLQKCRFCVTVSQFNLRHILENYPEVDPQKLLVQPLGVDCHAHGRVSGSTGQDSPLLILAAGRLHPVKDHAFLIQACGLLKARGLRFVCYIAGEGDERPSLEHLIRNLSLNDQVQLLGHLSRQQLDDCYAMADLVVLTSRSEGIPLVLMEAMAREKVVLAPSITGIPELVSGGRTGFLYSPGSLTGFVTQVQVIYRMRSALGPLRRAARQHVVEHFNRDKNLSAFCDLFRSSLRSAGVSLQPSSQGHAYENPVLQ